MSPGGHRSSRGLFSPLGALEWHDGAVPMRDDCKYFQTRTYRSGDVARFCALDMAPEAPWRCPEHCPRYTKRVGDAGFVRADLLGGAGSAEDANFGLGAAEVLGQADEVINAAGSEIMAEETRRRREEAVAAARQPWWQKLRRQRPWRR